MGFDVMKRIKYFCRCVYDVVRIFVTFGDVAVPRGQPGVAIETRDQQDAALRGNLIPTFNGLVTSVEFFLFLITLTCSILLAPFTSGQFQISDYRNSRLILICLMALGLVVMAYFYRSDGVILNRKAKHLDLKGRLTLAGLVVFYIFSCILDFFTAIQMMKCVKIFKRIIWQGFATYLLTIVFHWMRVVYLGAETMLSILFRRARFFDSSSARYGIVILQAVNLALWFDILLRETAEKTDPADWSISVPARHRHKHWKTWNITPAEKVKCFTWNRTSQNENINAFLYPFPYEFSILFGEFLTRWFMQCYTESAESKPVDQSTNDSGDESSESLTTTNKPREESTSLIVPRPKKITLGDRKSHLDPSSRKLAITSKKKPLPTFKKPKNRSPRPEQPIPSDLRVLPSDISTDSCPNDSSSDFSDTSSNSDTTASKDISPSDELSRLLKPRRCWSVPVDPHFRNVDHKRNDFIINGGESRKVNADKLVEWTDIPLSSSKPNRKVAPQKDTSFSLKSSKTTDVKRVKSPVKNDSNIASRRSTVRNKGNSANVSSSSDCKTLLKTLMKPNGEEQQLPVEKPKRYSVISVLSFFTSVMVNITFGYLSFMASDNPTAYFRFCMFYWSLLTLVIVIGYHYSTKFQPSQSGEHKFDSLDFLFLITSVGPIIFSVTDLTIIFSQMHNPKLNFQQEYNLSAPEYIVMELLFSISVIIQIPFSFQAGCVDLPDSQGHPSRATTTVFKVILLHLAISNGTLWVVDCFSATNRVYIEAIYFRGRGWTLFHNLIIPLSEFFRFNSCILFVCAYLNFIQFSKI